LGWRKEDGKRDVERGRSKNPVQIGSGPREIAARAALELQALQAVETAVTGMLIGAIQHIRTA
jgi:hypothetical protein